MVPEYLTPLNGGLLSPGQMAAVAQAVCRRMAGALCWMLNECLLLGALVCFHRPPSTSSSLSPQPPLTHPHPPPPHPRPPKGPEVWELELDLSPDQLPGMLMAQAARAFPNLIGVRITNAYIGG
jgi:hypothetical protein